MERRKLGRPGLMVSPIAVGGAPFGYVNRANNWDRYSEEGRKLVHTTINRAIDLGINYFDTAPAYAGDEALRRDEAIAEVTLGNGATVRSHVRRARGSADRPITDDDLDAKFRGQACRVLPRSAAEALLRLCRGVGELRDVGREFAALLSA